MTAGLADINPWVTPFLDVPTAGKLAFGLGRASSYVAAKNGDLPVVEINGRPKVVAAELLKMLGLPIPDRNQTVAP